MKYAAADILNRMTLLGNPANLAGMARFGINPQGALGISMPALRQMAKEIGKDHQLAGELWGSGLHEARILASLVDKPALVDEAQMERWAGDFDSWDVCDQVCGNLFWRQPHAVQKAMQWSERPDEFVKRAGFVLMAELAVHDKKAVDELFETFFAPIERESTDERNFVKKAVNWALRGIGKRNLALNGKAIAAARQILQIHSKTARWIASDALKELTEQKVQNKLRISIKETTSQPMRNDL
jgi:3-methyladenine DNA glycosylase AlkD